MILTALVSISVSSVFMVFHPVDDQACKGAPGGWLRGVVRTVDQKTQSLDDAKEAQSAFVVLDRVSVINGVNAGGSQFDATKLVDSRFALKDPIFESLYEIRVSKTGFATAVLTFQRSVFEKGVCLEIILNATQPESKERRK